MNPWLLLPAAMFIGLVVMVVSDIRRDRKMRTEPPRPMVGRRHGHVLVGSDASELWCLVCLVEQLRLEQEKKP